MAVVDMIDKFRLFRDGVSVYKLIDNEQELDIFAKDFLKDLYKCWAYINSLETNNFSVIEKCLNLLTTPELELCSQYIQTLGVSNLLEKHRFNIEYKNRVTLKAELISDVTPEKVCAKRTRVEEHNEKSIMCQDKPKRYQINNTLILDNKSSIVYNPFIKIYMAALKIDVDKDIFGTFYVYYTLKDTFFDKNFLNSAVEKIHVVYRVQICKRQYDEGLLCVILNKYCSYNPSKIYETRLKEYHSVLERILKEYNFCAEP